MIVQQDKFKIDDKVTWANDFWANFTNGRKRMGDGPFIISAIYDVNPDLYDFVGHSQHIYINKNCFSGAFFKRV